MVTVQIIDWSEGKTVYKDDGFINEHIAMIHADMRSDELYPHNFLAIVSDGTYIYIRTNEEDWHEVCK